MVQSGKGVFRRCRTGGWLALGLLLGSTGSWASEYTDLLKQELSQGGGSVDREGMKDGSRVHIPTLNSGEILAQPAFERRLKRDHPATHTLYLQLNDTQKDQAYQAYHDSGDFERATRKILNLLYGI